MSPDIKFALCVKNLVTCFLKHMIHNMAHNSAAIKIYIVLGYDTI